MTETTTEPPTIGRVVTALAVLVWASCLATSLLAITFDRISGLSILPPIGAEWISTIAVLGTVALIIAFIRSLVDDRAKPVPRTRRALAKAIAKSSRWWPDAQPEGDKR